MPFFVVVAQEIAPHALDHTLTAIQADFATSRAQHPGRRHTRVFQRLNHPTHLLTISEWEDAADYERLRQSPRYHELVIAADPPARIERLTRLRLFARMSTRPSIVACVTMTAPDESADLLRSYVVGQSGRELERSPGLLMHEVFQVGAAPGALLAVHGWRSLVDLERFRAELSPGYADVMAGFGVRVERFTGAIAAQFSRFEEPPGLVETRPAPSVAAPARTGLLG